MGIFEGLYCLKQASNRAKTAHFKTKKPPAKFHLELAELQRIAVKARVRPAVGGFPADRGVKGKST